MKQKIIVLNEFLPYFIIGGIATFIDWFIFAMTVTHLGFHYQIALIVSYFTAGVFHYTANKIITFKCSSKQIGTQFSIYVLVGLTSLGLSMGILALLVKFALLNKIYARMLTTVLMLIPNYLLHKHISFSKKIFIPN